MTSKPTGRPGRKGPRAEGAEPKSAGRLQGAEYDVGYGKPPKHTRFVKGQSGNPCGRPRKPKPRPPKLSDAPSDFFLEEEAYRLIELLEKGEKIELPTMQAVLRAMAVSALKGNRLSQRYFLEYVARQEARHLQLKVQNYVRLETLKRNGEQALAERERRGLPPPDLVPHPEDIILNPATGEAWVNGPETPEQVRHYDHSVLLRDHLLLRAAHADKIGKGLTIRHEGESFCAYLVFAQLLDRFLPRRHRWQDNAELSLMMEYLSLPRRERERRIAAEFAQLDATKPRLSLVTPEMKREIDRIARKCFKKRGDPPAERPGMHGDD